MFTNCCDSKQHIMQGKQALLCHQPVEGDDLENAVNEQGKDVAKRFEQSTPLSYSSDGIVGYPVAVPFAFVAWWM